MSTSLPAQLTPSPNVFFQELGNEAVLLDMASEMYYTLDDIAMRLWQLFSEYGETEQVIKQIQSEYEVDWATLQPDLAYFVNRMTEAGLLFPPGEAPPPINIAEHKPPPVRRPPPPTFWRRVVRKIKRTWPL